MIYFPKNGFQLPFYALSYLKNLIKVIFEKIGSIRFKCQKYRKLKGKLVRLCIGAIDNYCGDLFRDVPNGMGVRISENCAFMGMFQAGHDVSGVQYDASSNTLFAGMMTNGRRNVTSGDVYQLTPGRSCLHTQIIVPASLQ